MDAVDGVQVASLVVSVATLIVLCYLLLAVTSAQIAYAFSNLPRWDQRVLGEWARYSKRRYRWYYFRFETEFEVPFIFFSPANNSRGPLQSGDIIYVDGTERSCERTRVTLPKETDFSSKDTIDDRRVTVASWKMGSIAQDALEWNISERYKDAVPVVANEKVTWIPLLEALQAMERQSTLWEATIWRRPELVDFTGLVAGIQIGRRVLDSTSVIRKPYATTNMSSIVAMAAVLGLYWKHFDRDQDVYRAEGNGFVLRGSRVPHFGLAFSFEKTGRPNFRERRIIPTSAVHELCFGRVPTIFRNMPATDKLQAKGPEPLDSIQTLSLGSCTDIATTLTRIGCCMGVANSYSAPRMQGNTEIILPIPFQVTAMLGQVFYVKNRCFTYIPNPTTFPWPKSLVNRRLMLRSCMVHADSMASRLKSVPRNLELLQGLLHRLEDELPPRDEEFAPLDMQLLYVSLRKLDDILLVAGSAIVVDIVRRHVEAWYDEDIRHGPALQITSWFPSIETAESFVANSFNVIRPRAVELDYKKHLYDGHVSRAKPESLAQSCRVQGRSLISQESGFGTNTEGEPDSGEPYAAAELQRDIVWCTLFTRSLCWLLLHNFDEGDVQVGESQLIGSQEEAHIL